MQRRAESFDSMSDLPKKLREELDSSFRLWTPSVAAHQQAADGTEKLLLQLADGGRIECVLLREEARRSICVSSQVGCAMGCVFCASGLDGVDRNLSRGEILEQMLRLQRLLPDEERLSHIVMMGMGEPLANFDSVLAALEVARDPQGLGISPRRITISTVGLPAAIDRLAQYSTPFHLAISLHAPNNTLRDRLVPVNAKIGIDDILSAADRYFASYRAAIDLRVRVAGGHQRHAAVRARIGAIAAWSSEHVERDSLQSGRRFALRDSQFRGYSQLSQFFVGGWYQHHVPATQGRRHRRRLWTASAQARGG